jgi:hypothetical protein
MVRPPALDAVRMAQHVVSGQGLLEMESGGERRSSRSV